AMYLAKTLTLRSLPEIGRRFGGRDHTTVLHAVRKIEALVARDNALSEEVESLKRQLQECWRKHRRGGAATPQPLPPLASGVGECSFVRHFPRQMCKMGSGLPCTGGPSAPPCGPPGGLIKSGRDRTFRVSHAAVLPFQAARLFHLWRI